MFLSYWKWSIINIFEKAVWEHLGVSDTQRSWKGDLLLTKKFYHCFIELYNRSHIYLDKMVVVAARP